MTDNIPRGEQHHSSKLTEPQVREIRASYRVGSNQYTSGVNGYGALAKAYGCHRESIRKIIAGLTWKHLI